VYTGLNRLNYSKEIGLFFFGDPRTLNPPITEENGAEEEEKKVTVISNFNFYYLYIHH